MLKGTTSEPEDRSSQNSNSKPPKPPRCILPTGEEPSFVRFEEATDSDCPGPQFPFLGSDLGVRAFCD